MSDQPVPGSQRETLVYDPPRHRARRIDDLVWVMINLGLIIAVVLAGNYARRTTAAVATDVVRVVNHTTFDQILFLPLTFLQNVFLVVAPIILITRLLQQHRWIALGQVAATGICAGIAAIGVDYLLLRLPLFLRESLLVWGVSKQIIAVPTVFVATSAMITFVGERDRDRWIRWLWHGTWALLLLAVLQIRMTLTSAVLTVLLGNSLGLIARYLFGFRPRRAGIRQIITALRQIDLNPQLICRIDGKDEGTALFTATTSSSDTPPLLRSYQYLIDTTGRVVADSFRTQNLTEEQSTLAPQKLGVCPLVDYDPPAAHRLLRSYQIWDEKGNRFLLYAGDQDTRMLNWLKDLWNNMRWRGLQRSTSSNHRQSGEYAAMMAMLVERYQIRSRPYYGMVQAGESILNIYEDEIALHRLVDDPIFTASATATAASVTTVPVDEGNKLQELNEGSVGGETATVRPEDSPRQQLNVLRELWKQMCRAHHFDLTHRNLDFSAIALDGEAHVYVLDWEQGEAASSELSKALDLVQLLVFSAHLLGAEAALQLALEFISLETLLRLRPVCQTIALPPELREAAKTGQILPRIYQAMTDLAQSDPINNGVEEQLFEIENQVVELRRFSIKSLFLAIFGVVALSVILGSLDFQQLRHLILMAEPVWMSVGFLCALGMSVGQAWSLQALTPTPLRFRTTYLVQLAGSLTALVAPAGLGSATLNARYLKRQKMRTALSVATVTVHQSVQVLTSFFALFIMVLFTGNPLNVQRPSITLMVTIAVSLLLVAALLMVPKIRGWLWGTVGSTVQTVALRLHWMWSSPGRLLGTIGGAILQIVVQIACFYCALSAFGASVPLATLAVTFLVSNSVGSIIPTPGGLGATEAALTAGLKVAGVPAQTALAAALLYRLLTFWLRAALGWGALKILQRQGQL